jgi:hypothetical protein
VRVLGDRRDLIAALAALRVSRSRRVILLEAGAALVGLAAAVAVSRAIRGRAGRHRPAAAWPDPALAVAAIGLLVTALRRRGVPGLLHATRAFRPGERGLVQCPSSGCCWWPARRRSWRPRSG